MGTPHTFEVPGGFEARFVAFTALDRPSRVKTASEELRGAEVSVENRIDEGAPEYPGTVNVIIETDSRRLVLALDAPDADRLGAILVAIAHAEKARVRDVRDRMAFVADDDDDDEDEEDDYPPLTADEREAALRQWIPATRPMVRKAIADGCRTPVARLEVRREDGAIAGAKATVYDFENSAYRGHEGGRFHLGHEIDGIEATPASSYPIILWATDREDTTVVHAPIEGPAASDGVDIRS